ncbi:Rha family transcriptional regulator [Pseudomonas citronellolis]|uniref:Rha family transcriptional regulator n=1 Tax=Pseudomonas citronellolis TaxID=53408 RepID=UPI00226E4AFA|nr:Rha family transcriptional regulator [Pseudomonas citronellolis]WAB92498.1 Rha family transcriptional regulator [Pseudomonas citronellolis]
MAEVMAADLQVVDGLVTVTSLQVAERFGKRHDDVLKRIRNLECSPDFRLRNFAEAFQQVPQPRGGVAKYPVVRMTRDGFAFLTMGFTGKRAAQWKEAYIDAFNRMERMLQQGQATNALQASQGLRVLLTVDSARGRKAEVLPDDAWIVRGGEMPAWVSESPDMTYDQLKLLGEAALRRLVAVGGERAVREVLVQINPRWMLVDGAQIGHLQNALTFMLMEQPAAKNREGVDVDMDA